MVLCTLKLAKIEEHARIESMSYLGTISLRSAILVALLSLTSCATRFRVPLNRFDAPETLGGVMNAEFELSQQSQLNGVVDLSESEPYPIDFTERSSNGYQAALSIGESVDLTWKHTSDGPSMMGFKWQFMGTSLRAPGAGQSMSISAAFGGNSHEIEGNPKVEFDLAATDLALLHSIWLTPIFQIYESLSYSSYSFEGEVLGGSSAGSFADEGKLLTLAAGLGFVMRPLNLKLEMAYTKADWSGSGSENYLSWGFALGMFY